MFTVIGPRILKCLLVHTESQATASSRCDSMPWVDCVILVVTNLFLV